MQAYFVNICISSNKTILLGKKALLKSFSAENIETFTQIFQNLWSRAQKRQNSGQAADLPPSYVAGNLYER